MISVFVKNDAGNLKKKISICFKHHQKDHRHLKTVLLLKKEIKYFHLRKPWRVLPAETRLTVYRQPRVLGRFELVSNFRWDKRLRFLDCPDAIRLTIYRTPLVVLDENLNFLKYFWKDFSDEYMFFPGSFLSSRSTVEEPKKSKSTQFRTSKMMKNDKIHKISKKWKLMKKT